MVMSLGRTDPIVRGDEASVLHIRPSMPDVRQLKHRMIRAILATQSGKHCAPLE